MSRLLTPAGSRPEMLTAPHEWRTSVTPPVGSGGAGKGSASGTRSAIRVQDERPLVIRAALPSLGRPVSNAHGPARIKPASRRGLHPG